ncbi:DNA recombination and repair protein RecF [hydrothermal vent metagenome]|uniref:DNA replication and repair protein RecF n=1 Tax=hydrothermal vent metagenome TaxID=652676 RepID=A0A3B0YJ93_9ZZZZ
MPLSSLSIEGFRNLKTSKLSFSPGLNLFSGENAAGKTSLLEAIYILGRASSFRSNSLDRVISHGQPHFQLAAQLQQDKNRIIPVGLRRKPGKLIARMNSEPVRKLSELAALFPLQWVGGNLHELIESGPPVRRQFLDWGLFHVKQDYIPAWKQFQKLIKQRNAALRTASSPREITVWDRDLAQCGEILDKQRTLYMSTVCSRLIDIMDKFIDSSETFEVLYRRGWSSEKTYKAVLEENLSSDREQGFTRNGPQRADFSLKYRGRSVNESLSRGQQKLLIIGLKLSQASVLKNQTGNQSLFLLDDLGAELDQANQGKVMRELMELDAQIFATAISFPEIKEMEGSTIKLFHVKHGKVTEVV